MIKDPPFSKLDLITCRNLLIYLGGELQKRLIPLFHYALNPGGFLFLGTSETVGDYGDLFAVVDRKQKLYRRKEDLYTSAQRAALGRYLPPLVPLPEDVPPAISKAPVVRRPPLRELTEQALLRQLAAVGILVNAHGDILYLHGRTGRYLELAPGESGVNNVLKMARDELRRELTTLLHKAASTQETVCQPGLRLGGSGDPPTVNLTVCPMGANPALVLESPLYLIIIETGTGSGAGRVPAPIPAVDATGQSRTAALDTDPRIIALRQELRAKEEYLQSTNEELETSNEEMKSTNEEMQSVNEELQSTNEELETSKEELQSVNEELGTVNAELQNKVADLTRVNNDMNNLLAGTGIGTVFVDRHLRILRFTPAITQIINLIPSDVGRPVAHIVSNLVGYDRLVADAQAVLDTLIPQEAEVQTLAGVWYTMRVRPYRTLDNVIEGVVLTFVDITERKRTEAALLLATEKLRALAGAGLICTSCQKIRDGQGHWCEAKAEGAAPCLCPECKDGKETP